MSCTLVLDCVCASASVVRCCLQTLCVVVEQQHMLNGRSHRQRRQQQQRGGPHPQVPLPLAQHHQLAQHLLLPQLLGPRPQPCRASHWDL